MRHLPMLFLVLATAAGSATAQADRNAERAARRTQMQVQQLQQQLQQAQSEKTRLDTERTAIEGQLKAREQAAARAAASQRVADHKLKTAESEREALAAKVAELERALQDARRSTDEALAARDRQLAEAAGALKTRQAAEQVLQVRFAEQVRLVTECTDKNERLTSLSAELVQRYRSKGVWQAAREREPLLGLSDVQSFNLLQDYVDRADADRFVPNVERR